MKRSGTIELPLHTGKAPRWLFEKMVDLCRAISHIIIMEKGADFFVERLSSPMWFQALGCVLGFDWHSSGLSTVTCGALKEAFKDLSGDTGIYVCGGKGATSRKTPREIESICGEISRDPADLVYSSRMVAKVDSNALQDGFSLYHHTFIFTDKLDWVVVQQGMSQDGWARRYHWYSKDLNSFVKEPHEGIVTDKSFLTLNMVDEDKDKLRSLVAELASRSPEKNLDDITGLKEDAGKMPQRHQVLLKDVNPRYLDKIFLKTYEKKPGNFESLLGLEGVGAKTLRSLALIGDLIYGEAVSFKDPARFSFTHGGKDGYPYRIDRNHYQGTIDILDKSIQRAKIGHSDKLKALKRLYKFYNKKGV